LELLIKETANFPETVSNDYKDCSGNIKQDALKRQNNILMKMPLPNLDHEEKNFRAESAG
jgi:hypothetical protein